MWATPSHSIYTEVLSRRFSTAARNITRRTIVMEAFRGSEGAPGRRGGEEEGHARARAAANHPTAPSKVHTHQICCQTAAAAAAAAAACGGDGGITICWILAQDHRHRRPAAVAVFAGPSANCADCVGCSGCGALWSESHGLPFLSSRRLPRLIYVCGSRLMLFHNRRFDSKFLTRTL